MGEPENEPPSAAGTQTTLGAKLTEIRAEIVQPGEPLLDWKGNAQEVAVRRGEHDTDVH